MKYYAVIDTNVIVSTFLKKGSVPEQIISYVWQGKIIPLVNDKILKEYREVLLRPKFRFNKAGSATARASPRRRTRP